MSHTAVCLQAAIAAKTYCSSAQYLWDFIVYIYCWFEIKSDFLK